MEIWLPVVSWEGFYEVSDLGNVRSVPRVVTTKSGQIRRYRSRPIAPYLDRRGRVWIDLSRDGSRGRYKVSHLVLSAFIHPKPADKDCLHANDNPADNRLCNLRWGTRSENWEDRKANGFVLRSVCRRGHPLEGPNLSASLLKKGVRTCASCRSANTYILDRKSRGLSHPDVQEEADRRYALLVSLTSESDSVDPSAR